VLHAIYEPSLFHILALKYMMPTHSGRRSWAAVLSDIVYRTAYQKFRIVRKDTGGDISEAASAGKQHSPEGRIRFSYALRQRRRRFLCLNMERQYLQAKYIIAHRRAKYNQVLFKQQPKARCRLNIFC
jgi:hypothetical protein